MNVSIKESLVEELRRFVPVRQRSLFIAEAVRDKLDHLKQERAVRAGAGTWSAEGRADPEEEVREWRRAWKDRQVRHLPGTLAPP
ncbi:MAG TPA: hypothetical protein VGG06_35515 [Thermoanaerobaculia bacterium]|jgi:predicted transcriptional regulator